MTDLPTIDKLDLQGKNVLVRGDFDVDDGNNPRADSIRNIIRHLQEKQTAKIKIIGHTETQFDLAGELVKEFPEVEFDSGLRKDPGEKANDPEFARKLAEGWDVYVNEAFATSHREHASIVNCPKIIKESGGQSGLGLRFEEEINNLSKIFADPVRPVVIIISGIKEDKLAFVEPFCKFADKILIAGRLPDLIEKNEMLRTQMQNEKIVIADLIVDKEDITIHSMERFEEEIKNAGTIVVSGPVGKFEDEGHSQGTKRVFQAVANNVNAFKVAGGGDTEQAIKTIGIGIGMSAETKGFNWISVGGGAMLEFLTKGTLPGIEILLHN